MRFKPELGLRVTFNIRPTNALLSGQFKAHVGFFSQVKKMKSYIYIYIIYYSHMQIHTYNNSI